MRNGYLFFCIASAAVAGPLAGYPSAGFAETGNVTGRVEKLEERVRDAEARLAKVEAMVNQHASHPGQRQPGSQGMQQGNKGAGGGSMMDDDMMGMPDPAPQGQGPANPPGAGAGGMGGHM
jgi:hypothetical protein